MEGPSAGLEEDEASRLKEGVPQSSQDGQRRKEIWDTIGGREGGFPQGLKRLDKVRGAS